MASTIDIYLTSEIDSKNMEIYYHENGEPSHDSPERRRRLSFLCDHGHFPEDVPPEPVPFMRLKFVQNDY